MAGIDVAAITRRGIVRGSLALLASTFAASRARASTAPVIAAAADLRYALEAIAAAFRQRTGRQVRLSFGSSGNLTRQILAGAPFEVFLSADEDYALQVVRAGLAEGDGRIYAIGHLALVAAKGADIARADLVPAVESALAAGRMRRFAIANPEHAPYGARAREALQASGLWKRLQPRLVLGENVAQAAQYVASGAAQMGIVGLALAISADLAPALAWSRPLPSNSHAALRQRMVLLRRAGDTARLFYAYLEDGDARAILQRHGFSLP